MGGPKRTVLDPYISQFFFLNFIWHQQRKKKKKEKGEKREGRKERREEGGGELRPRVRPPDGRRRSAGAGHRERWPEKGMAGAVECVVADMVAWGAGAPGHGLVSEGRATQVGLGFLSAEWNYWAGVVGLRV
ncbi:uncharacterized protein LOC128295464 [Gossypium arboreum]|uniref:uncharacterized protein LOC128295464 n=1 Tax=Gossypium arboreum TaxID=29729 RepID=UPI0022F1484C|nr:uncharacterized protein LOC128295464 [Gossypium arboreum]